ncbi:MAG: nucleoside kinase [Clostridiales Family XIII bacterium]|jgi:uridine kinase|nr:nucleoside kinase [Clostridiales Family XIII bacterium]
MIISIELQPQIGAKMVTTEIESGTTLESLLEKYQADLPYRVMAASVNNRIEELTYAINEPCTVKFLDMRTNAADRIYQRSLCLVYLKAIDDVLGKVDTDIFNSLNRGLYTEINAKVPVTDEEIKRIEGRMREIVNADFPIRRTILDRTGLLKCLEAELSEEKSDLLRYAPDIHYIAICELEGYRNYFYGQMVPSSGYLRLFELRRYRDGILLRYPHPSSPGALPPYVDDAKLFEAFEEGRRIGNLFHLGFAGDLNREIENGKEKEIIQISERLHAAKIHMIADMIADANKRIILIAGPSSSGKTTFSKRLIEELKGRGADPLYLGTDDYFVERVDSPKDEFGENNYEDIDAIDLELFNDNINDLLSGRETILPTYNFISGKKEYVRKAQVKEGDPIVIEGIHALNSLMSERISDDEKFKIYISPLTQINLDDHNRIPTTDVRLIRRIIRDNRTRGHSVDMTIKAWPKVRRGEDVNIFPYNGEADVVFNSALIYELSVLRLHCEHLLSEVRPEDAEYGDACRLLDFLRFFRPVEDESNVPAESILREFIGN